MAEPMFEFDSEIQTGYIQFFAGVDFDSEPRSEIYTLGYRLAKKHYEESKLADWKRNAMRVFIDTMGYIDGMFMTSPTSLQL